MGWTKGMVEEEVEDPSESNKGAPFIASVRFEWLQAKLGIPWLVTAITPAFLSIR